MDSTAKQCVSSWVAIGIGNIMEDSEQQTHDRSCRSRTKTGASCAIGKKYQAGTQQRNNRVGEHVLL
jgi:hypothetical protein